MAQGLILRDASNKIFLDTNDRCARILGTHETGVVNGELNVDVSNQGKLFIYTLLPPFASGSGSYLGIPKFTIGTSKITWEFGTVFYEFDGVPVSIPNENIKFIYGTF